MLIRLNLRRQDSVFKFGPPTWLNIHDEPLSTEFVGKQVNGARVCLLIHGFNVDDAVPVYSLITEAIENWYEVIIAATWPGSVSAFGFWAAERRADIAGRMLAEFCGGGSVFGSAYALDMEGHSCGCRVALEAVSQGLKVRNLVLAAAAVDNESIHIGGKYGAGVECNTRRTLVAYSRQDDVLKDAFSLSSRIKRWARLDFKDDCRALGYTGPQDPLRCPINVKAVDLSESVRAHGDYKRRRQFFDHWGNLCA